MSDAQRCEPAEGPITQDEMVAMFGERMPIQAVELLWSAPPGSTVAQLRARLREIARTPVAPTGARPMSATCETCRWWHRWPWQMEDDAHGGECRVRAPILHPPGPVAHLPDRKFPQTVRNDWCGEHQPKEPDHG